MQSRRMDGERYGGADSEDAQKDRRVHQRFLDAGMKEQMRIQLNVVYVRQDVEHLFQQAMRP